MTQYTLCGHDLTDLLDVSTKKTSFAAEREGIPCKGAIIYSVWDEDENFIYVGISGVGEAPASQRIAKHASGKRGGNNFCTYVCDYFVIPTLRANYKPVKDALNDLTGEYICANFSYRFVSIQTSNSADIVRCLERHIIKNGACGLNPPLLNNKW